MPPSHRPPDPLCRIAAVLSVAAFLVLAVDAIAPATVTAPHVTGAQITSTLAD